MTGCLIGYFHCVQQLQYHSRVNLLKRERRFNSSQVSIPLVTRCFSYLSLIKVLFGQLDFFIYQISLRFWAEVGRVYQRLLGTLPSTLSTLHSHLESFQYQAKVRSQDLILKVSASLHCYFSSKYCSFLSVHVTINNLLLSIIFSCPRQRHSTCNRKF